MSKFHLYFVGIVPDDDLREKIRSLKEEMSRRFNARHALKSPAHITLQMPFKHPSAEAPRLLDCLQQFAAQQKTFLVTLSGFDCFAPKVIFVKVADHRAITNLHDQLKTTLIRELDFKAGEVNSRFHPHLTIATRDLRKADFRRAWPEFQQREFNFTFEAGSIFLLRHNGRFWDIYREFLFGRP